MRRSPFIAHDLLIYLKSLTEWLVVGIYFIRRIVSQKHFFFLATLPSPFLRGPLVLFHGAGDEVHFFLLVGRTRYYFSSAV